MENGENGDESYLSSNTVEAYARIGIKTFFKIIFKPLFSIDSLKLFLTNPVLSLKQWHTLKRSHAW